MGPAVMTLSLYSHLWPHPVSRVLVRMLRCATWLILARASPLHQSEISIVTNQPIISEYLPEPVSGYAGQVRELSQFTGGEPLRHNGQVFFTNTFNWPIRDEYYEFKFCVDQSEKSILTVFVVLTNQRQVLPVPLSWICSIFIPPALTVTVILLLPASIEFSSISLIALAGLWITSPAAILFTTTSSSFLITPGRAIFYLKIMFQTRYWRVNCCIFVS